MVLARIYYAPGKPALHWRTAALPRKGEGVTFPGCKSTVREVTWSVPVDEMTGEATDALAIVDVILQSYVPC